MSSLIDPVIQGLLFTFFAGLTAILQGVLGATYEGLLVPELQSSALYPTFPGGGNGFFAPPIAFSDFLLVHLADPAVVLVVLALGLLYLARSFLGRETVRLEAALPRVVIYVVLANVAVPVAGGILDLAGSVYPLIAGFDGGAWQSWPSLDGSGAISFSWDNGAVAFILSLVLFSLVLLLAAAVALRSALLAVLLVLLPVLTLVGAFPPLRELSRRAWLLFAEAAFLPCVLVIPLELAVGSPSILLLAGYLTLALGSPVFLSKAGTHLAQLGFPSPSGALSGGIQRGLSLASLGVGSYLRPLAGVGRGAAGGNAALSGVAGAIGRVGQVPFPASVPIAVGELLGAGAAHLARHLGASPPGLGHAGPQRFPGVPREGG